VAKKTAGLIIQFLLISSVAGVGWADDDEDGTDGGNPGAVVRWSPLVELSGFGDIVSSYRGPGLGSSFQIGQAEIDLTADLGRRVGAEIAIAYENEAFTMGAFVVGVTLYERAGGAGGFSGIDAVSISAGQFDVPFGIDWKVYPSFDRKLISVPLVVEGTHGAWNDFGATARLKGRWGNASAFAVDDLPIEGAAGGENVESIGDYAGGGRLGLKPWRSLEIGASYAHGAGDSAASTQQLAGADVQYGIGRYAFKGEYIAHTFLPSSGAEFQSHGFYIQALCKARGYYLVARHDAFDDATFSAAAETRSSAGAGWIISEHCQLRFEYQRWGTHPDHSGLMQIAFAF
jgi:hypothetical protein